MKIRVFTDGACSGNPGPGGWGALINYSERNEIISGNEANTTNNRMELKAVVQALEKLAKENFNCIEVHSDSAYVINAVNLGWLERWKYNNWLTTSREPVKNKDLWKALLTILRAAKKSNAEITFVKVKGHAGNFFNETVDRVAVEESMKAKNAVLGVI